MSTGNVFITTDSEGHLLVTPSDDVDECPPRGIVRPTSWARLVELRDMSNVIPFRKPSSHGAATKR